MVAGALADSVEGMGNVMVAVVYPEASCSFSPFASSISTATIPNAFKILCWLLVLIPRKSPGINLLKFAATGFK